MTVTQPARDVTTDPLGGPPPPPALTSPRRTRRRQSSKHDVTSDVMDDDLGIFEDEAECEDLTDSEAADLDPGDADPAVNGARDDGKSSRLGESRGEEEVTTPRDPQVKIEVSISRRSKAKDETSVTSSEVAFTLTPRSERSDETLRPSGFRPKTNTPVSGRSEAGGRSTVGLSHTDRQSQGGGSASREAMYQQALNLMSQRCVSSVSTPHHPLTPTHALKHHHPHHPHHHPGLHLPLRDVTPTSRHVTTRVSKSVPGVRRTTLLAGHREPATGYSSRGVVVVTSSKRTVPMPPLKAWRGFTGNLYFEPIKVKGVTQPIQPGPSAGNTSPADVIRVKGQSKRPSGASEPGVPDVTDYDINYAHSSPGAPTFRSHLKTHKSTAAARGKPRKMVIVDKGSVFSSNYDNLLNSTDDIEWVVGGRHKHVGGSLKVKPEVIKKTQPSKPRGGSRENGKFHYNKEKICRGSVAHRDFALRDRQEAEVTPALSTKPMNSGISPLSAPTTTTTTTGNPAVRPENSKSAENSKNGGSPEVPNGKLLPPLDPPTKAGKSKSPTTGAEGDPRDSLALEHVKPSEHHPHPKDKPYVKYSRDVAREPSK